MAHRGPKGIFCLETDWWGVKDKTSIEPIFHLLAVSFLKVPYIHRDVGTRAEFEHYLKKWTQKGLAKYPVLYLGFHGEPGLLNVGEQKGRKGQVSLSELAELLKGKCKGKVIHFGSCSTLGAHGNTINEFLRRTGALAVLGYKRPIDWIDSAAFELLLIGELQNVSLTRTGMHALERKVRAKAPGLAKRLDFRIVVS